MAIDTGDAIHHALGQQVTRLTPLGGGCVGNVARAELADGRTVVAKTGGPGLAVEGFMLGYLASTSRLPVPEVLYADDRLLVMAYVATSGGITKSVQAHAAELLADLHDVGASAFGFERATVIGGLAQPNPWSPSWVPFFRDHRLRFMAGEALAVGRLPARTMVRIDALAGRLERWLDEPATPSLIHGDAWAGNVLCRRGRVAAFVDPAIYHGDAEIELAFTTLFQTFGKPFFDHYRERRPLRPGFFEARRDLYNLYPLLVHVRLFGGAYVASVERTLARFGC